MTQIDETDLEGEFKRLQKADERLAAEVAYVLAVKAKQNKDEENCRYYAGECLRIFRSLDIQTLEEAAARLIVAGGVALPGIIHEKVVQDRFLQMGIPF